MTEVNRRSFALMGALGLSGSLGACATATPALGSTPPGADAPPIELGISDRIRAAEDLLGVSFTDAERAQMAEGVREGAGSIQVLREHPKPNSLAPATVFDPRLPGKLYGLGGLPSEGNGGTAATAPARTLSDTDLAFAGVTTQRRLLDRRQITSVQLTQLYLDRIAAHADALECFITVTPELALRQARDADRRLAAGERGPLLGIPYAAKDLFDTAGIRTTYGAEPFRDRVATDDAWVVRRLADAGAPLLGKTTLGALAYGDIWFGGRTNNPWNLREGSSGSSAGSASAVAAGLCSFALGTETLGSLVSPSTRCGTATLRPTFGTVPRTGAMALVWSMDKIGPIVRHIDDAHAVLSVITGWDPGDPSCVIPNMDAGAVGDRTGRMRVGVDPAWFEAADSGQRAALDAIRGLADVVDITDAVPSDLPLGSLGNILVAEAASAFEMLTLDGRDDTLSWQDDAAWPNTFRTARFLSAIDMIQADRVRRQAMQHMGETFTRVDALLSPPFAGGLLQVTNYTGHPCATIRAGFSDQPDRTLFGNATDDTIAQTARVPNSVVLWGALFDDARLIALAGELERALGVASERPAAFAATS